MVSRRGMIACLALAALTPTAAVAQSAKTFVLAPEYEPRTVAVPDFTFAPGTIVVDPPGRFIYLIEAPGTARRYGIGVGRAGLIWAGTAEIGRKAKWPSWRPTPNMIKRDPKKYARYANGMKGGPGNPLGSRALYIYRDGNDTLYRIHGTTEPWTIGKAVSNGCIRMLNEHVEDLYERVAVGAPVVVLR